MASGFSIKSKRFALAVYSAAILLLWLVLIFEKYRTENRAFEKMLEMTLEAANQATQEENLLNLKRFENGIDEDPEPQLMQSHQRVLKSLAMLDSLHRSATAFYSKDPDELAATQFLNRMLIACNGFNDSILSLDTHNSYYLKESIKAVSLGAPEHKFLNPGNHWRLYVGMLLHKTIAVERLFIIVQCSGEWSGIYCFDPFEPELYSESLTPVAGHPYEPAFFLASFDNILDRYGARCFVNGREIRKAKDGSFNLHVASLPPGEHVFNIVARRPGLNQEHEVSANFNLLIPPGCGENN